MVIIIHYKPIGVGYTEGFETASTFVLAGIFSYAGLAKPTERTKVR